MELKDNFTWILSKDFKKEIIKVSGKIKLKEEQVGINIFSIINIGKEDKEKIINGYIYKSILIKYDIIMIDINLNYYKLNKTSLEKIKNGLEEEIKRIKESNSDYQRSNVYIHIDNAAILYPQSYDLFLHNLVEKDIISINQVQEEYQSIVKLYLKGNKTEINPKQNENIKEDKISSYKEFVDDKINEKQFLGNNLKTQDFQNNENNSSLQVSQLKENLEKEQLKNKDLSEKIKKLENKIAEENNVYEKEIKELKLKLSRYPLLLNEGDKLMSIIFTTGNRGIYHSVICKNNELFSNVENRLYEEGFPEYKETKNFFTFKGLKVNKDETLEENKIKNSDVIILNVLDDDD